MGKNNFASIESIISVAKKGGMFILVDDEKRENEGDLVFLHQTRMQRILTSWRNMDEV